MHFSHCDERERHSFFYVLVVWCVQWWFCRYYHVFTSLYSPSPIVKSGNPIILPSKSHLGRNIWYQYFFLSRLSNRSWDELMHTYAYLESIFLKSFCYTILKHIKLNLGCIIVSTCHVKKLRWKNKWFTDHLDP